MASITDKFGKASINTDYAIATTVKTTRVPGATVLEAFDLSKFTDDTPVFFVTYKKTTDPVTDITSVTNLVSWKGLVNAGANTVTNLTLAPGYTDTGNAIGDFVECIPTSHWVNSLIDGIFVSHNPDGTLRDKAATLPKINGGSTAGVLTTDASGNVTASSISTYTNTGAGGGTGYYTTLGNIKMCWGTTGSFTSATNTSYSVSLPSGFFTTVQHHNLYVAGSSAVVNYVGVNATTSTVSAYFGTAASNNVMSWFVIGV